jgi:hypothetical protein
MATVSIASLGLGNADLTVIGKLSETGLSQTEVADAVVEGDKLKKGNITAGQVGAYTKAEVEALVASGTDLSDYYNKAQVDSLIGAIPETDLSNYYNKTEVYNKLESYSKAEVDSLIAGGGADLSDYYTKAQVDSLIDAIPETDLTNYYNKTEVYNKLESYSKVEVDNLIPDINTKQDTLVSATNIKTINGESILGSGDLVISGGGAVDLSDYYKKTETYSKVEVDTKIADIPPTDLSGYYNKTEVNNIIDSIPATDLSNYYDKTETYSKVETNSLVATKQDTLVSGNSIKTINGQSVLGSGDIVITGGGSGGSSTFTGTAAIDIGGIKVGDSWDNVPISDVVNAIINPELFPTFVNPTFSFASTVNGFKEVGSITDITFNVNFSRGSITPQYSAENNYRSGSPTTYNYNGPVGSEVKANNTLTDTKTITGYSIAIGNNTFSCSVDYSIGTQPKSSKGNDYNTPLPAGTLAAKSVTITGVYPVYNGIGTLSKIPLQAHGTAIVVDAPADMVVGGNRFTIQYPNVWSAKTPVVQQENELSKAWDNQNMSDYSITTIDKNGVSYKQVEYIGAGIGARKLKLVF